jgi:hypothetical protein
MTLEPSGLRRSDFLRVPLAAVAVMAANVAVSVAVVWAYSSFVAPGGAPADYAAFAERAAPVSSVVAGVPLMLLAGALLARRRSPRAGLAVAGSAALVYAAIDLAVLVAAGASGGIWLWAAASWLTKLLAALAGARLVRR